MRIVSSWRSSPSISLESVSYAARKVSNSCRFSSAITNNHPFTVIAIVLAGDHQEFRRLSRTAHSRKFRKASHHNEDLAWQRDHKIHRGPPNLPHRSNLASHQRLQYQAARRHSCDWHHADWLCAHSFSRKPSTYQIFSRNITFVTHWH